MTHGWYEATGKLNTYVSVVMLDFSKAFDFINLHILLDKLTNIGLLVHIVRWIGAFLHDRRHNVIIGKNNCSRSGCPSRGVPQGTMSGPKCFFLLYINDLESHVHLKPLSHRIVRLLDRTIGCYLSNVRPIGNVCYDRQQRSHTAIGLSSWW